MSFSLPFSPLLLHPAMADQQQPITQDGVPTEQHNVYSSSILFEKQPIEAMESLLIRHKQAKIINKELSEWLTNYGRLRLHYVDELKKIHKRGEELFTDTNPNLQNSKLESLGLCHPLWMDLLKIVNNEIELFDQSTRKMGRDMIAPLRLFTRNNDSNLIEMDSLVEVSKHLKNSNANNTSNYEEEWLRNAPYFFEIFENYDYERISLLKDVFLKFQTDLNDVLDTFKKDNEVGLQHVLNLNVDDEIKRFSQDVISTNLPIENIKLNDISSSRTSTTGFTTTSPNTNDPSSPSTANSKRHSTLLSPRHFHLKKNENERPESKSPSNSSKRLSSGNSVFSSTTASSTLNSNDKRKDRHSVRSKFGSIFKGRKKNGKDTNGSGDYVPPSTIHEPDNSSINTENTTTSSRVPATVNTQKSFRTQSIVSNNQPSYGSPQKQQQPQVLEPPSAVSNKYQSGSPSTVEMPNSDSIQNSPIENNDDKALPSYLNYAQEQSQSTIPQQQHIMEKKQSQSSIYEAMRPTKRSDSLSSSNIPTMASISSSTNITSPLTSNTGKISIPEISRGMENIPESLPVMNVAQPPPPPTSRKHISTNDSMLSNVRQPHGSVPTPPSQRKSMLVIPDQEQPQAPLQPAETGTKQNESTTATLARNTTGGGGLVGGQIMHPALSTPGLNSSIVELFNATFKDGKLIRSNAIGEIAFSFISNNDAKLPNELNLQILSKNSTTGLPNFMVNTMFLQQLNEPGLFKILDPSQISMRTVGGLKYMLNNPIPPINITPIWKHEDNQSTVIISVKPIAELEKFLETESLKLSNFMISVSIQNALVSSAATKPSGSLNKEKGRVTWISANPIVFNASNMEERYVARFLTNQKASESESGVQIRFNVSNNDGASRIDFLNTNFEIKANGENLVEDPFGGDGDSGDKEIGDWFEVPTVKSLVAGSYSGHS